VVLEELGFRFEQILDGTRAPASNSFASVFVLSSLRSAPFHDITHVVEHKDCERSHALPLFGTERLVQRLPSLGELIQIGGSLRQCFRTPLQESNGIAIAHHLDRILVGPSTDCFLDFCNTSSPILRPGANGEEDPHQRFAAGVTSGAAG
jgi:hypothetical protein